MIVDQELGFVTHTRKNDLTAYLCIVNERVVGIVLTEEITAAYRLLPQTTSTETGSSSLQFGLSRSIQPSKAVLGIYQIWVHQKYRNRGIASVLVDMARKHAFYGYSSIPVQHVAFSSPTESGLAFARQYNGHHQQPCLPSHDSMYVESVDVLVYDCC
jgi:ribosomal protein S18 acetylase RimI-like enzyme